MVGKQKVLIIVGPTSSGKSALAVELARRFNGEVISADSRQVYKGLDIGTGKVTKREMRGVRHHLLDVASPKRVFTAHDFAERARAAIEDIASRGKLPVIAGGTGFYIDAFVGRIVLPDAPANAALRARLETKTAERLFALLKKKDPSRAKTVEPRNKRRLIRALEIISSLGHVPHNDIVSRYGVLWIGLTMPAKELGGKIRARLIARMKKGMVAEARRLHKAGLSYRRMGELGLEYRALAHHLQGTLSREEMIDDLNRAIRRYAKKQLAYWKRNLSIRWFDSRKKRDILRAASHWLH